MFKSKGSQVFDGERYLLTVITECFDDKQMEGEPIQDFLEKVLSKRVELVNKSEGTARFIAMCLNQREAS